MRTITITALVATLVAIPFILRRHRAQVRVVPVAGDDDPRRYDVFDFVSGFFGWMRDGLDDADRNRADEALRATIVEHTGEHGVTFQSATWIIEAHKP